MGKKKVAALGSENENELKAKKAVKLEQKKKREGKASKNENVMPVIEEEVAKAKKKEHIRSKNYVSAKKKVELGKAYPITEALKLLKEVSLAKFDSTVEMHITLAEKGINKELELPFAAHKSKKVAIADDETIAKIEKGDVNFDILLASPAQMGKLVKLAKVLGPKGLMPNPKNGTVIADPEAKAKLLASKSIVSLKCEKDAPVIHLAIARLSHPEKNVTANIKAVLDALSAAHMRKVILKSTMSPSIKLAI